MPSDEPDYLHDMWTYYFHDPEETNWNLDSYTRLGDASTVQDFWAMHDATQPYLRDGMFFVMRGDVYPCWDDPGNINGGCLSLKVPRDALEGVWLDVMQHLLGERLLDLGRIRADAGLSAQLVEQNVDVDTLINGVSVSPKRFFSIIKLWLRSSHLTTGQWFCLPTAYDGEVLYKANVDNIKDSHRQDGHRQDGHRQQQAGARPCQSTSRKAPTQQPAPAAEAPPSGPAPLLNDTK